MIPLRTQRMKNLNLRSLDGVLKKCGLMTSDWVLEFRIWWVSWQRLEKIWTMIFLCWEECFGGVGTSSLTLSWRDDGRIDWRIFSTSWFFWWKKCFWLAFWCEDSQMIWFCKIFLWRWLIKFRKKRESRRISWKKPIGLEIESLLCGADVLQSLEVLKNLLHIKEPLISRLSQFVLGQNDSKEFLWVLMQYIWSQDPLSPWSFH